MASKALLLVAVFCFCLFSVPIAEARKFETGRSMSRVEVAYHKNIHGNEFTVEEEGYVEVGDLISVDYTPVRKKPPIHN
ncbi:hypothetical protein PanWU01x14_207590 [Parasponia andersonii]|uniref:Uncharacterized protein n=1 Tax=Parasponia andersonii TaxID=3476 RepID=A0A2P5BV46_PARAD|nr:hypothetical protein PanWU01x14_207590 [Parasponia andersonii]